IAAALLPLGGGTVGIGSIVLPLLALGSRRAWPLTLAVRVLPGRLGDLAIDLIAQLVHLTLCPAQGCGLVAEDPFGGSLDALFQVVDPLAGALGGFGRVVGDAGVEQAPGDLEC